MLKWIKNFFNSKSDYVLVAYLTGFMSYKGQYIVKLYENSKGRRTYSYDLRNALIFDTIQETGIYYSHIEPWLSGINKFPTHDDVVNKKCDVVITKL